MRAARTLKSDSELRQITRWWRLPGAEGGRSANDTDTENLGSSTSWLGDVWYFTISKSGIDKGQRSGALVVWSGFDHIRPPTGTVLCGLGGENRNAATSVVPTSTLEKPSQQDITFDSS